ncbi:MAG: Rdx family protein [Proteobacteria bacterium]|nr:SelT/SelW/SelH family protein [Desulfobulbaceae bacterium]MBU4154351.1 Rdx family protein [Pseudomonadota bacterium]
MGEQLAEKCNAKIELIAGSGGVLDVYVDGMEIFSKKKVGHFPSAEELYTLITLDRS